MHVQRFTDPREFLQRTKAMLMRSEAENCVFVGSITTLPDVVILCAVLDEDEPVAAAVMTQERHLFMTATPREASKALVEFLVRERISLPGVQSRTGDAEIFADIWAKRTGDNAEIAGKMGVYKLNQVLRPGNVSGQLDIAREDDVDLITRWIEQFGIDIGETHGDPRQLARERIAGERVFMWKDRVPVSMAAWAGPTPNGVRINLVYTPPEFRRRGYASACVAALSQRMLDSGKQFCFLYTDLANPTSNKIYRAIGYEHVRDDTRISFKRANV